MYANESEKKDSKTFNCVQRGHQNCLESLPQFLALLLLGGLQYFRGYSKGSPAARNSAGGGLHWFAFFGILFCTIALVLHQLNSGLISAPKVDGYNGSVL